MDTLCFTLCLFRPVALGGQHRKACSYALGKAVQQKHDRSRRPHRRQSVCAYIPPYNNGIRHIVKLLKNISNRKGQRKHDQHLKRASFCHILFHCLFPFWLFHSQPAFFRYRASVHLSWPAACKAKTAQKEHSHIYQLGHCSTGMNPCHI